MTAPEEYRRPYYRADTTNPADLNRPGNYSVPQGAII